MEQAKFVDGLIIKKPRDNAPDFVKGSISIKREELAKWLNDQQGDWINLDIKESQKGTWYAQINEWKPEGGQDNKPQENKAEFEDKIPF